MWWRWGFGMALVWRQPNTDTHLQIYTAHFVRADLFAVLGVGEVNEVVIVHLLRVDDVTVLLLAQVLRVDAVGSQELLVSHAECLANGLGDQLRLQA